MMKKFFWILLLCLFSVPAFSDEPCDPDFDPWCEDPNAPIDSGVGLLIGAAAFYTVKKIREKKDTINTTPNNTAEAG